MFQRPAGGYGRLPFAGSVLEGLPGLLLSPNRGLFVFSPVFLAAILGVYCWWRRGRSFAPTILGICLVFSIGHILLISRWQSWWGGFTYGPRMLTDIVPCLAILLIPAIPAIERSAALKVAFAGALAFSIAVQAVGAFCYPNGHWDGTPQSIDAHPERVWDWRDTQIGRTAAAGPVLDPYRLAWRVLTTGSTAGADVRIW